VCLPRPPAPRSTSALPILTAHPSLPTRHSPHSTATNLRSTFPAPPRPVVQSPCLGDPRFSQRGCLRRLIPILGSSRTPRSRLRKQPCLLCGPKSGAGIVSIGDVSGRKLRGGRRYFRSLRKWPESIDVPFGRAEGFDCHWHPDFWGWSRRSGRARQQHLTALFQALRRVLEHAARYEGPAQVFVFVYAENPARNALYVQTPKPGDASFPYGFDSFRWDDVAVPGWLRPHVGDDFEVGETVFESDRCYTVAPKGPRGRTTTR
jgi:hypothetical protein